MLGVKKNEFQSLFWLKYELNGLDRVQNPKNALKCLRGWGGSKLVLDINKNKNNICLGCGFWATGHKSHNPCRRKVPLVLLTGVIFTLFQACLRAPPVVADEAKLAIVGMVAILVWVTALSVLFR